MASNTCQFLPYYFLRRKRIVTLMTLYRLVVEVLFYKLEGRGFETQWGECFFFNLPNLLATLGPAVYSVSNRNTYQNQRNNVSRPSVTRLSRQCGILNISQSYRFPRSVTGIAFLFYFYTVYCPIIG
jgi:hypothetical protein